MLRIRKMSLTITTAMIVMLVASNVLPSVIADGTNQIKGFDKGPSYTSVVPIKKTTFVGYDENSILDDYAYLAAIPTTVFNYENKLFSHPLLFYQDAYPVKEDKERSLNARQGIDYFMEDWMSYCNGELDQMTLINVPEDKLNSNWRAKENVEIKGNNPFDIASKLALQDWSYSDSAVMAVIEESFKKPSTETQGILNGNLPACDVYHQQLEVQTPVVGTGGTYTYFDINNKNYKYIVAKLSWPGSNDYDLQLYDTQLGMVDSRARYYADAEYTESNLFEITGSYIHNYGKWGLGVTAVAVKSIIDRITNYKKSDLLVTGIKNLVRTLKNMGTADISLYPGTLIEIPEKAPYGCRDVKLTLTWKDPNKHLGLTLLDPVDTEICSSFSREELAGEIVNDKAELIMSVDRLGECREEDRYSVCVFSLDESAQAVDFTLEYNWRQNFSKIEGECFASASNGAVLASSLNAPLLYLSTSEITDATKGALYKLGVKNIYLINIGNHLSKDTKDELDKIASVTEYNECGDIYKAINEKTGNDRNIVFTTIDPWTYWYATELKPAGEYPGALFVGPAAYIAAHHGSPVIIIDLHPQLSQASVWPTDFWVKTVEDRSEPSSGCMLMAGRQVYDFLEEYGLGRLEEGNSANQIKETIITVADQYDIGTPWDRMLTGAAYPGRFCFSPVDTAYWISRNVFYPVLIYVNPALQGEVQRINGSSSKAKLIGGRLREPRGTSLVITKPSGEEKFTYPILHTYTTYGYKFNEKTWEHWNFRYSTADGIIPYVTPSPDPIDDGATDKPGAYYPDFSESEVVPFYATRAGYDNVFSTNFEASVENLNRGVIIWVENCHGWQGEGGMITMWDPDNPYVTEENPWRAYEPILLYPGNLREFFRYMIYALSGQKPSSLLSEGLIKFHLLPAIGSTENPDVACANFQKILLNKIVKKIKLPIDFWSSNGIMLYRDRLKHPIQSILQGLPLVNIYDGDGKITVCPLSGSFPMKKETGIDFDNALENLHSCGLNTISCLPAETYLHMTWMRHGMAYQIIDPWTTSDWSGVWTQMVIKRFAMGDTIGQAYELGMRSCGPEPIVGQWWWDTTENVELFGDPNLRVFVPGTEYSDLNNWEKTNALSYDEDSDLNGHMLYGAKGYPHSREPETLQNYLLVILGMAIVAILLVAIVLMRKNKKKRQ